MSTSAWLVPLNVHHSLKLRSLSSSSNASSVHLQNISSSLTSLTNSINRIERNSIELTGTANAILELLQSNEYKETTIGAMRNLLFNHAKTCKEATNEDDCVLAYSICVTSKRIMNQPWFNFDLFSLVSFDEMEKASEIQETCQNIMKEIEEKMDSEERNMISVFVESMDKIEEARVPVERAADEFVELYLDPEDYPRIHSDGKQIRIFTYKSGEPAGWLTAGTRGKSKWPRVFSASRDISEIPIRSALPYLEGRKTPVPIEDRYFAYGKKEWCRKILKLHRKWKIENNKFRDFEKSIIVSANDLFDGRIRIEQEKNESTSVEPENERIGFLNFSDYSQLSVNTGNLDRKDVRDEEELGGILSSAVDFWTVILDTEENEFVQSAGSVFEYWKDEEMILQISMEPEEAIQKLFSEYLN